MLECWTSIVQVSDECTADLVADPTYDKVLTEVLSPFQLNRR